MNVIYWYSQMSYQEAIEATSYVKKKSMLINILYVFFITCFIVFIFINNSLFFYHFIWNEYDNLLFVKLWCVP